MPHQLGLRTHLSKIRNLLLPGNCAKLKTPIPYISVKCIRKRSTSDWLLTGRLHPILHFSSLCLTCVTHIVAVCGVHTSVIWSLFLHVHRRSCVRVLFSLRLVLYQLIQNSKNVPRTTASSAKMEHSPIFAENSNIPKPLGCLSSYLLSSPVTSNLTGRMHFIFTTQIFTYIHTSMSEWMNECIHWLSCFNHPLCKYS